jgi:TusA-related sulfurtransferase
MAVPPDPSRSSSPDKSNLPDKTLDGGDLDCGSGLLLILRDAIGELPLGGVLELVSRETSVKEDLPAWCRMVGHEILGIRAGEGRNTHYLLRKGADDGALGDDRRRAREFEWKVRAAWTGGMKTRVYARNHSIDVGQPASFETADEAPAAVETLLAALGGCLVSGFAWRLSQRGLELRAAELSIGAKLDNVLRFLGVDDSGSAGLSQVHGVLYVDSEGRDDELEGLWTQTVARSPVASSLASAAQQRWELRRMA